ncbi:hypothetical protein NSK_008393 [Nannochloropsis salina CCMP1776]|uniref:Uncharacterized protein n=1 Tax=Nannochloropsis salina CCMP1776 TaxID=1027361 RepID=A0A4D9CMB2_9STRA|nr:hypothetical protein NSK_008393 [Nannochloropsis salina CCMP1776]|eukprot:TFJ80250.1 hypothetical protein NSK_008393 [Nannochloropsis salina CCMP1776]
MLRFVRPMLSWNQDAVRVAAYTFAVSARATITTAFSGPCAAAGDREHHSLLVHWQQQRRHRWAGVAEFDGSKQAAMQFLDEGAQFEGLVKRWDARKYYIKPFVQRKQRYNRWVRRRSMEKINRILERVRYEKANARSTNPRLAAILGSKGKKHTPVEG